MRRSPARRVTLAVAVAGAALAVSACGDERQDADEPAGEYRLEVIGASFPASQQLSAPATMAIRVRNPDDKTVPNLAVTVETAPQRGGEAPIAFGRREPGPEMADPARPIWIVDRGPDGGDTAYTNTWALGRLPAGQSRTLTWRVTAVQPGTYTVRYRIAPGLDGRARLAAGSDRAQGSFRVRIENTPPASRIGENGEVIRP